MKLTMISREVSLFVFYNINKQILLQDRRDISKAGEEWGFFGGALEDDETPKQALTREIKEEMSLDLNMVDDEIQTTEMSYFNTKQNQEIKLKRHIFVKEYGNEEFYILEGSGSRWFDLEKAKKLKLVPGDLEVVEIVQQHLRKVMR